MKLALCKRVVIAWEKIPDDNVGRRNSMILMNKFVVRKFHLRHGAKIVQRIFHFILSKANQLTVISDTNLV